MWLSQLAFIHHRRGDHFRNTDILSFLCLDSPATWGNTGERYAQPRQCRNRLFECDTLDRNRWLGRVWGFASLCPRPLRLQLWTRTAERTRPPSSARPPRLRRRAPSGWRTHCQPPRTTTHEGKEGVRLPFFLGCRFLFCLAKTLAWRSAQSSLAVPVFCFFFLSGW